MASKIEPKSPLEEALGLIYDDTVAQLRAMADEFQFPRDQIEKRIMDKAELIKSQPTVDAGRVMRKKALGSLHIHLLHLWASKKIFGPMTPENLDRKAKQAEGLAKLQSRMGNDEGAAKQLEKAAEFQAQAQALRTNEPIKGRLKHMKHQKRLKVRRRGRDVLQPKRTTHHDADVGRSPGGRKLPGRGVRRRG